MGVGQLGLILVPALSLVAEEPSPKLGAAVTQHKLELEQIASELLLAKMSVATLKSALVSSAMIPNFPRFIFYLMLVDGGWTTWTLDGTCSVTCGDGTQQRTRACTDPAPVGTGATCGGSGTSEIACNDGVCPGLSTYIFYHLSTVHICF